MLKHSKMSSHFLKFYHKYLNHIIKYQLSLVTFINFVQIINLMQVLIEKMEQLLT